MVFIIKLNKVVSLCYKKDDITFQDALLFLEKNELPGGDCIAALLFIFLQQHTVSFLIRSRVYKNGKETRRNRVQTMSQCLKVVKNKLHTSCIQRKRFGWRLWHRHTWTTPCSCPRLWRSILFHWSQRICLALPMAGPIKDAWGIKSSTSSLLQQSCIQRVLKKSSCWKRQIVRTRWKLSLTVRDMLKTETTNRLRDKKTWREVCRTRT